ESAPLLLAEGTLVFETNLGAVAALDPADGGIQWISRYRAIPAVDQHRIIRDDLRFALCAPRFAAGRAILAPQDSEYVFALDLRTGREAWRFGRDRARELAGISGGRVVLAGPGALIAVDAKTGRTAWEAAAPPADLRGAPFAAGDRVYVSTADH